MRAEAVVFNNSAPVAVGNILSFCADAVFPVIGICKATTGPANQGNADMLQCIDDILAYAADVWHRRVLADPKSVVDHAAKVLGKVAVDVLVDMRLPVEVVYQVFCHSESSCSIVAQILAFS